MKIEDTGLPNSTEGSRHHTDSAVLDRQQSFSERRSKMRLLSVEEVATILGVSQAWVRDHATRKQPHLKVVKVGKLLKFRPDDVDEFIETWCR